MAIPWAHQDAPDRLVWPARPAHNDPFAIVGRQDQSEQIDGSRASTPPRVAGPDSWSTGMRRSSGWVRAGRSTILRC
jgi:hypothetical protein